MYDTRVDIKTHFTCDTTNNNCRIMIYFSFKFILTLFSNTSSPMWLNIYLMIVKIKKQIS